MVSCQLGGAQLMVYYRSAPTLGAVAPSTTWHLTLSNGIVQHPRGIDIIIPLLATPHH